MVSVMKTEMVPIISIYLGLGLYFSAEARSCTNSLDCCAIGVSTWSGLLSCGPFRRSEELQLAPSLASFDEVNVE